MPESFVPANERSSIYAKLIIAYLAVPNIIFLTGFVRPLIGLPAAAITIICLFCIANFRPTFKPGKTWAIPAALTIVILWLAGLPNGGNTYDWIKHWAIQNALIHESWPVRLNIEGQDYWLRYYVAAYLPTALLGKLLAAPSAAILTTAWLGAGIFLLFKATCSLGASWWRGAIILCGVLITSGLDFFIAPYNYGMSSEWLTSVFLGIPLQIPSPVTQLAWAPHQAVPAMLTAWIVAFDRSHGYKERVAASMCMLALWSPAALIGLTPIAIWVVLERITIHDLKILTTRAVPLLAVPAIVISYLSSASEIKPLDFAFIPHRVGIFDLYLIAMFIELAPLAILLGRRLLSPLVALSLLSLVLMALITGTTADLVMRGSAGPIFILSAIAFKRIANNGIHRSIAQVAAVLAIGAMLITTAHEANYLIRNKQIGIKEKCGFGGTITRRDFSIDDFFMSCGGIYFPQYFSESKPPIFQDDK